MDLQDSYFWKRLRGAAFASLALASWPENVFSFILKQQPNLPHGLLAKRQWLQCPAGPDCEWPGPV